MREITKKICLLLVAVFISSFALQTEAADLSDLYKQRDRLNDELQKAQSSSEQKSREIKSLSAQINSLQNDIEATEARISDTNSRALAIQNSINDLNEQIKNKTDQLNELKKKINAAIVEIYRFSARSNWELVFGSSSLGENSNQVKYVEAIQVQVKSMYNALLSAKEDLDRQKSDKEAKKEELDNLKLRQEEYQKNLQYQVNQKDKLMNMSVQQKRDYDSQIEKLRSEITHISAQIYAERQKRLTGGREQLVGGGSGYPYSEIDIPDAWGFLTRECTSYAAWYWNVVLGKRFINTRPGEGSAYNWPNLARDQGYSVSNTPSVGAIISWSAGPLTSAWGHVAIVEAVNGDGTINVSEYNWIRYSYSYRKNVNPWDYGSHSFIR